jgi:long-chain acyl-CoA synthetase
MADSSPRTVPALWQAALAANRSGPAYLAERDGGWVPVTWQEAGERVNDLANGLLALGIEKGDAFGILAATCLEWVLFDHALALVGAVTVPIYATSSPRDVAYALDHTDAVGVFAENEQQLAKLDEIKADIPRVRHVLTVADLDDLAARGREHAAANPQALERATGAIEDDDLYTFIFTSGTTGSPKACMILHRNAHEMVEIVHESSTLIEPDDVVLLWLPLAHNFGRLLNLSGLRIGFTIAFCADPNGVAAAIPQVRPHLLPGVPRIYEKVYSATQAAFDEATGVRRKLIDWSLGVGRRTSALRQANKPLSPLLALQHRVASRLVYSKFKERLGGRIRVAVSGAAPLSVEIEEFFHALDVLILEGYGLTECTSAATANRPDKFRFGTVGPAMPRYEAKLADDGELLLRSGTIFAGYYKDEAATREVVDADGWLHTGDVAEIDADGFVKITDRKKDIIVTAGGKKIPPQNLENELKNSKFVSQALVVGDRRPYVAALVTVDQGALQAAGVSGDTAVHELVQGIVDGVNDGRTRYEQIKRFTVLPRDFSVDEGELTPTLKLRRKTAEQHFAEQIDELYEGDSKD